jgi:hypothetical protein
MKHSMLLSAITSTLAVGVMSLLSTSATAQTAYGSITSINQGRTTINAKPGETLAVSVEGKGACQSILFSPGESPMTMILTNNPLPMEVKHRYQKVGKYQLKVTANSPDCNGKGEITVRVK